jgi:hypothetical protein
MQSRPLFQVPACVQVEVLVKRFRRRFCEGNRIYNARICEDNIDTPFSFRTTS